MLMIPISIRSSWVIRSAQRHSFWLNLQNDYDVQIAKRDLGEILDRIEAVNKPRGG
jgi:plasmid maintenance system antidote protein VapI